MAKKVKSLIKLQVKGGAANPAPPIGPALGTRFGITQRNRRFRNGRNGRGFFVCLPQPGQRAGQAG